MFVASISVRHCAFALHMKDMVLKVWIWKHTKRLKYDMDRTKDHASVYYRITFDK